MAVITYPMCKCRELETPASWKLFVFQHPLREIPAALWQHLIWVSLKFCIVMVFSLQLGSLCEKCNSVSAQFLSSVHCWWKMCILENLGMKMSVRIRSKRLLCVCCLNILSTSQNMCRIVCFSSEVLWQNGSCWNKKRILLNWCGWANRWDTWNCSRVLYYLK